MRSSIGRREGPKGTGNIPLEPDVKVRPTLRMLSPSLQKTGRALLHFKNCPKHFRPISAWPPSGAIIKQCVMQTSFRLVLITKLLTFWGRGGNLLRVSLSFPEEQRIVYCSPSPPIFLKAIIFRDNHFQRHSEGLKEG